MAVLFVCFLFVLFVCFVVLFCSMPVFVVVCLVQCRFPRLMRTAGKTAVSTYVRIAYRRRRLPA